MFGWQRQEGESGESFVEYQKFRKFYYNRDYNLKVFKYNNMYWMYKNNVMSFLNLIVIFNYYINLK